MARRRISADMLTDSAIAALRNEAARLRASGDAEAADYYERQAEARERLRAERRAA